MREREEECPTKKKIIINFSAKKLKIYITLIFFATCAESHLAQARGKLRGKIVRRKV